MKKALIFFLAILSANILKAQPNSVHVRDQNGVYLGFYNTIAAAYAAIPTPLTGPYLIEMDTGYKATDEHYPILFTHKAGVSSTNTITLTVTDRSARRPLNQPWMPDTSNVFVLDNADWMIFDGKNGKVGFESGWWLYTDTATAHDLFSFVNGSCNIVIRDFYVSHMWGGSTGNFVYLGPSAANTSGNSDILIENCNMMAQNRILCSQGTPANPNKNIIIRKNNFSMTGAYVLRADSGTGRATVTDNNVFYYPHGEKEFSFVNFQNLSDSLFIERNLGSATTVSSNDSADVRAIVVAAAPGGNNYARIVNNVINANMNVAYTDPSVLIEGIIFEGSNPVKADVYFNTIKIEGNLSHSKPTPFGFSSAALHRTENSSASVYNIKNNIFVNTRQGGIYNTHLPIALNLAGTVNIDYNTYNGDAHIGKIGTGLYTSNALAAYRSAFTGGNEVHSDTMKIDFLNDGGHQLFNTMFNHPRMQGIPINGISIDHNNEPRAYPYRGADELNITCNANRRRGELQKAADTLCAGRAINISSWYNTSSDLVYQWQQREAGSGQPFTDINGSIHPNMSYRLNRSTEFRLKDSCLAGGMPNYSDTITVFAKPLPPVDTFLIRYHGTTTYSFYVPDADTSCTYLWNFGDGSPGAYGDSVTYAYATSRGNTPVSLSVTNACGYKHFSRVLYVGLWIHDNSFDKGMSVYPNPATNTLFTNVPDNTSYLITDLSGKQVLKGTVLQNMLDVSKLAPGHYFIGFAGDNGIRVNARFVKE